MCLLVFCVTLVAYLPALEGGFIWDDIGHVTRPELRSVAGLGRIWFEVGATQQYYPVLHTAFWIEHHLWGGSPLGYHLINVLLHATAACLLGAILQRLFEAKRAQPRDMIGALNSPSGLDCAPAATDRRASGRAAFLLRPPSAWPAMSGVEWLAALLFALHPVCVESVAWIAEQKNTLSTVLYLCAALAYLRFDERRRGGAYALATALFLLALLTKTVTATLPAALLVVFWWRRGHLAWRRDVLPLLPWFAPAAAAGCLTAWFERELIGAQGGDFTLNAVERCLLAGRVIWFYLGKLFWPADLVFIYPRWMVDSREVWQWLLPLGVVALLAALWWWRHRGLLAGTLFFIGSLFPALGFVNVYPFIFSFVADHFQYLACLGILVPVAAALAHVIARLPRWGGWPLAVLVLAALGTLTWRQSGIYRDNQILWRTTLERNPNCWMAHNNLGLLLYQAGRRNEAMAHYREALRIKPDQAQAEHNLGLVLADGGRREEAIAHYEAALRLSPSYVSAHNNLGIALQDAGRMEEALIHFREAARLPPALPQTHINLGNLLRMLGRSPEAVKHYREALRLLPDQPEVLNSLGLALMDIGQLPEAVRCFEEALRVKPDWGLVRLNLGLAEARSGRLPEAIEHFKAALQLNPQSPEIYNDLGTALHETGHPREALACLQQALRLRPDYPRAHSNLALILIETGRLEEAINHLRQAVQLDPGSADAQRNLGLALRQAGREAEAVEHLDAAARLGVPVAP